MSFPSKADREKCWGARDEFWKCLDDNNGSAEVCSKFRQLYENSCPSQWVKHFDRKREYLKFKDRIQEGTRNTNSSCNTVAAEDVGVSGRQIITTSNLVQNISRDAGGNDEQDSLKVMTMAVKRQEEETAGSLGIQSESRNLLCIGNQSNSNTKVPSPRIFRRFQPPTFT